MFYFTKDKTNESNQIIYTVRATKKDDKIQWKENCNLC